MPRIERCTDRAPSDDATYVQELVAYIQDRAQSALGAVAFGRSGEMSSPPMPPPLGEQREATEPWLLRLAAMAALEYFAIRVARLLDEPVPGIASLPEVFKVLRDTAVREAVLNVAVGAAIDRPQREQHMERAVQCWRRVRTDARQKRLRRLRDHTLAHNLIYKTMKDGLEAPLLPVDLIAYGEDVLSVVDELAWACLGASRLDYVRTEAERKADQIWRRLRSP
jgi:hypothetical protein